MNTYKIVLKDGSTYLCKGTSIYADGEYILVRRTEGCACVTVASLPIDAAVILVDEDASPSRHQESDTEPKGPFYEAKQAALDYIQKAKDGPTPEPFTPKEGDVLIAIDPCVLQGGFRHGMNALTVNAEYKVISCNGNSFVITDDIGNGHTFTFDHAHKYFKRKP